MPRANCTPWSASRPPSTSTCRPLRCTGRRTGSPSGGFRAAAARVVDRIAVPTLIVHALDDPFVMLAPATLGKIAANPHITLLETEHGGHCAFLAKPDRAGGDD